MKRLAIVLLLSLLSITLWAPDLRRAFGHPIGMADMLPWEFSLRGSDLPTRLRLLRNGACWMLEPGQVCRASKITANGASRPITVVTKAEPASDAADVLYRCTLALLFLGVGATLVLLRPRPATWAFFALSLFGWSPINVIMMIGPPWWQVVATAFDYVWETCVPFAGIAFALYLLAPQPMPEWRAIALRTLYLWIAVCATGGIVIVYLVGVRSVEALLTPGFYAYYLVGAVGAILTPIALAAGYFESPPAIRERLRWVIVGFSIAAIALSATTLATITNFTTSYAVYSSGLGIYTFAVTATTSYAVLRHRIIDLNVVISRAVAYTVLSAIIVGLFALVDLFFTRTLSVGKAGFFADIAFALVLGFFLNSMHNGVDRLVDNLLFRNRHLAEKHLATVASALQHVQTQERVDQMLVDEPVGALDLSFGALARCMNGDAMEIVHASREQLPLGVALPDADALKAYLLSERRAIRLREQRWHAPSLAFREEEPSVAIPIFSHAELAAVAFFAPHRNATEIDADELALIERVATAAGAAYDRLEAKALRAQIEEMGMALPAP